MVVSPCIARAHGPAHGDTPPVQCPVLEPVEVVHSFRVSRFAKRSSGYTADRWPQYFVFRCRWDGFPELSNGIAAVIRGAQRRYPTPAEPWARLAHGW